MTIQRTVLLTLAPAVVAFDVWIIASRCPLSPPIRGTATLLACLIQVIAMAIPIIVERQFVTETLRFRATTVLIAVGLFLCSLPMFETAVLYGDSIETKFYSVGLQCHGHIPLFGPNNRWSGP